MKRSELLTLISTLDRGPHRIGRWRSNQAADFLRQIAEAQPVAWRVEVRWADITLDSGKWRTYADYRTEKAALSSGQKFANPGDIESRIVPLYTLPMEY